MDVPILSNKREKAAWSAIAAVAYAMLETRCVSIDAQEQRGSPHITDAPFPSLGRLEAYCRRAVDFDIELRCIEVLLADVNGDIKGVEDNTPGNHYGHRDAGRDYARCHPAFRLDN